MTRLWLLLMLLLPAICAQAEDPKAYIRQDGQRFYVAVYSGSNKKPHLAAADIAAAAFQDGRAISHDVDVHDPYGADFRVFLNADDLKGDFKDISVAVVRFPLADGSNFGFLVDAGFDWSAQITLAAPGCAGKPAVTLSADEDGSDAYQAARQKVLKDSLNAQRPRIEIEEEDASGIHSYSGTPTNLRTAAGLIVVCQTAGAKKPNGQYDERITYTAPDTPVELRRPLLKTELTGSSAAAAPAEISGDDVTKRPLEQNLDLGLQYASSVKTDSTTGAKSRESEGTFDIRFAPILNTLGWPSEPGKKPLIRFYTPFAINAQVSTGKITTDTLSTNTIQLSSQYEWRKYHSLKTYPTFMRYIASVNNYSDRDFKNAEVTGKIEFRPYLSFLNHPLSWRVATVEPHTLDPDPSRGPKVIYEKRGFGYAVTPVVSFEGGGRYRDKSPLAPFDTSDFVRRTAVGGEATFDLTSYVSLSLQDQLFIRGESSTDRTHNYFKTSIQAPLQSLMAYSAATLFVSFERGTLPPFSTPNANSVKAGIRIQANGWFQKIR